MNANPNFSTAPLVQKLASIFPLSDVERAAVERLPVHDAEIKADQDIVREGDRPSRCFAIVEGVTCSYKMAGNGKRQIVAFHIAGDIPDVQSLHLDVLDVSFATITPCRVAFIRHDILRDLCERHPRIGSALWRSTLIDAAIFREWMTSIGRRPAYPRIAHLMCELVVKFRAIGLQDCDSVPFPITQAELGDALGLSNVHVNRSIQNIRTKKLIELRDGRLKVLDWEGLQRDGEFDPTYLHLKGTQAGN